MLEGKIVPPKLMLDGEIGSSILLNVEGGGAYLTSQTNVGGREDHPDYKMWEVDIRPSRLMWKGDLGPLT